MLNPGRRLTLLTVLLSACAPIVPATAPPQLEHTPGAFAVVTDAFFDAGRFRVDYPKSWRVVKTSIAADDHLQVVFAAPDGGAVTLTEADSAGDEPFVALDHGIILQIRIQPGGGDASAFVSAAKKLAGSIRY